MLSITRPSNAYKNLGITFMVIAAIIFGCHHISLLIIEDQQRKLANTFPICQDAQDMFISPRDAPLVDVLRSTCWSGRFDSQINVSSYVSPEEEYSMMCKNGQVYTLPNEGEPPSDCSLPLRYKSIKSPTLRMTIKYSNDH